MPSCLFKSKCYEKLLPYTRFANSIGKLQLSYTPVVNLFAERWLTVSKNSFLLLIVNSTHSTCGVLCTVSVWRGVRGCLNILPYLTEVSSLVRG